MKTLVAKYSKGLCALCIYCSLLVSCSITKAVDENESVLVGNKIVILDSPSEYKDELDVGDLNKYIKQTPQTHFLGFNPKVAMYNISQNMGRPPVIYDKSLTEGSISNLEKHLTYLGYYDSNVTNSVRIANKKAKVTYYINLGKSYIIDSIEYSASNEKVLEILLKNQDESDVKVGTRLSESKLETETERLESVYRNLGYFNFSKNHLFFKADTLTRSGHAKLYIDIKDYTRDRNEEDAREHNVYTFAKPLITTIRSFQNNRISTLSEDSSRTARRDSLLRVWRLQNDTIDYKNIQIVKRGRIPLVKNRFLNRVNLIKEGELYSQEVVEDTYSRFASLGMFSSVNIQSSEKDSLKVIPLITLQANALQGYKLNLQGSVNSNGLFGISPEISYFHRNLFRGAELFTLGLNSDFQFKPRSNTHSYEIGAVATLNIPKFLLAPDSWFKSKNLPHTEVSISYNYQDRPEYKRNIFSTNYSYTWSVGKRLYLRATPLRANYVRVFDLDSVLLKNNTDPFFQYTYKSHFDLGVGANLYYTTDNSANPLKSYFYTRFQLDLAGNLVSLFNKSMEKNERGEYMILKTPYTQYCRAEVSVVYTHKFKNDPSHMLAFRVLAGVGKGYGNSKMLPFEQLFWGGGAYSLRGWQARTLGPGSAPRDSSFVLPNQTGDMRLEANVEYRFPIAWLLKGAVFIDAGNIWRFKGEIEDSEGKFVETDRRSVFKFNNFYKHLALDWGIGLRMDITFVVLRLDLGFKAFNPEFSRWVTPAKMFKNENFQLSFGIGYPF